MTEFKRSHYCGEFRQKHIDQEVTAMGWVHTVRDMGGIIFIDLRDKEGLVQVVFDQADFSKSEYDSIESLRSEYVLGVRGRLRHRDEETYNPKIPTGEVEIKADDFVIFSKSKQLPFPIEEGSDVREELRLKYRYLDLRREDMYKRFQFRNKTTSTIRNFLEDRGFLDVETPILTKSTPEGARDYLVPSRLSQGEFYALPQSPQIFKQLLMVSGFDRYYQIAKCFRDEDLRADRQPEFTQVDIETSFMDKEEILNLLEDLFKDLFLNVMDIDIKEDFPRISYQEAMLKYGSDKPDIRFGLEIVDVSHIVGKSDFKVFADTIKSGGVIRSINVKGGNSFTRAEIEELTQKAIDLGAKGMAWITIDDDGSLRTILDKYISKADMDELFATMGVENGDLLIFCADRQEVVEDVLGSLRLYIGDKLDLRPKDMYRFLIVEDFPLLEYNEDQERYVAMHHPFTRYVEEDKDLLETDPLAVRAQSYDVVLNGIELGSGSLRIYDSQMQEQMFDLLGFTKEELEERFGFLLEAFSYGTPPHGGFAFGLDRLVMLMTGDDSIREVIAFPKNREAQCLLTDAPSQVADDQLQDLSLAVVGEDGKISGLDPTGPSSVKLNTDQLEDVSEIKIEDKDKIKEVLQEKIELTRELRARDFSTYPKTINIHPVENATRPDVVVKNFQRDQILSVAEDVQEDGHILVPSIVEEA